jgi:methionyl-tRNA formyltransferase
VSFGLFVPSRLLTAAKYGGVNVHPSLLPEQVTHHILLFTTSQLIKTSLRGPAPLHHTLLSGRTTTGITLQTLHHKHFDQGLILDQTPAPGIPIPNPESCTLPELLGLLAPKGAEMLINGIRNRVFVPPLKEVKSQFNGSVARDLTHAAKITPEDRHIKWREWSWTDINRRQRVLSPLWSKAFIPAQKPSAEDPKNSQWKRIIFDKIEEVSQDTVPESQWLSLLPGVPFIPSSPTQTKVHDKAMYVYTADGKLLRLKKLKVEGEKFNDALTAAQKAHMLSPKSFRATDAEFSLFFNPLC